MSKSNRARRLSLSGSHRLRKVAAGLTVAVGFLATTAVAAVAAGQPTLVVAVLGSGVVKSQPAGIACPPKCSASFPAGANVVLTVKPRGGSSFLRWGGACTGAGQCSVKVTSLVSVAAQFAPGAKPQAPPATKTVAVPGSYTAPGASLVYGNFSFFVAPSGTKLLNVSVPVSGYAMGCTPSGSFPGPMPIVIPAVPIKANGAFSAAVSVPGVFDNAKASFKYSFAGRFATATSSGPPTAAGTLREDIVFQANGATENCTSKLRSWTATHDPQQAPAETSAEPGSYTASGASLVYGNFSFFVAPSGTKLLNVSVPVSGYAMGCTPSGSFPGPMPIVIPAVPIKANGAFSAAVSVPGVFDNAKASFKYSFAGYFEGATPAGPLTVAGTLREDITFPANGVKEECTSDLRPWTATHDPQQAPAKTSAEPGSYTAGGASLVYGGFSFSVAAGGTKLLNVSVPISGYAMGCAPGGSFPAPSSIIIPQVAVKPDGSFAATVSNNAPYDSTTAKFTYSFAGNFEGATPAGAETVAGSLREDIVFAANGAAETCTSNLRPWTAVRNS